MPFLRTSSRHIPEENAQSVLSAMQCAFFI
ncbi:hypothetical protein VCHENC02_0497A, partial [Vibrio harveyi]